MDRIYGKKGWYLIIPSSVNEASRRGIFVSRFRFFARIVLLSFLDHTVFHGDAYLEKRY